VRREEDTNDRLKISRYRSDIALARLLDARAGLRILLADCRVILLSDTSVIGFPDIISRHYRSRREGRACAKKKKRKYSNEKLDRKLLDSPCDANVACKSQANRFPAFRLARFDRVSMKRGGAVCGKLGVLPGRENIVPESIGISRGTISSGDSVRTARRHHFG
jgi:hypothetical protein